MDQTVANCVFGIIVTKMVGAMTQETHLIPGFTKKHAVMNHIRNLRIRDWDLQLCLITYKPANLGSDQVHADTVQMVQRDGWLCADVGSYLYECIIIDPVVA